MASSKPLRTTASTLQLPPSDLRPSAYDRIKEAILSGELEPGRPLVEAQLAAWCGVSRTPVREALTRLEQDRLVARGDRGLVVRQSSPEEILDLYDTRIVLEAAAARFAAERRTEHDLRLMRNALPRMAELGDANPSAKAASNADFHRLIWRASHNGSMIDLLERLGMHLGRYPATTLAYPGRWESSNTQHDELVEAIAARDAELAATIATTHFSVARDIRLALFDQP